MTILDEQKEKMVEGLMNATRLKREVAVQALETNGWNYPETLQKAKELIAANRVPSDMLQ